MRIASILRSKDSHTLQAINESNRARIAAEHNAYKKAKAEKEALQALAAALAAQVKRRHQQRSGYDAQTNTHYDKNGLPQTIKARSDMRLVLLEKGDIGRRR